MKNSRNRILTFLLSAAFLFSCKPDKDTPQPVVEQPETGLKVSATYDSTNFKTNAATELKVVAQLNALVSEMKKGRVSGVSVFVSILNDLYTTGKPSLKDLNTTYYDAKVYGKDAWLSELSGASGNIYTPSDLLTGDGGYFGKYLFDEHGLELEQKVEKGMFGSVLYNHFITIINSPVDSSTSDKILAILGSNPTLPSSNVLSEKNKKPDMALATYIARRDKNDGNGFYSQFSFNIRKLQAAAKGGSKFAKEQQEAISAIKILVEQANAATAINYCKAVITTMSKTTTTDDEKGAALHAYGECVGFIHGWKTLPAAHKKITDAEIDELLVLLKAPADGIPSSYLFVTKPAENLIELQKVQDKLKAIYGFSDEQMNDFAKNWIAEQKR